MSFLKNILTPGTPDAELVAAYKQSKDTEVLGVLYGRYMELVYGVCLKYLKNTEEAKDAVMQIFEELILKIHRYEIDTFRSWLYTLAKNYCLMQLRSPKNMKTVEFNPVVMQSAENEHLNTVFQKEENLQKMEQCLQKLSTEQKQSVELFYLQNKCYKEIAVITGKETNKVRSLIQNGRRNLKICMEANTMVNG